MGTATSRRAALGLAATAVLLAGCGGRTGTSTSSAHAHAPETALGWLVPSAPPPGWPTARIPSGATLAYPPGWTRVPGDPGTASVALFGAHHSYVGYLNLTPQQGAETLADWAHFRVEHNAEEGDRDVRTLAVAAERHLKGASASCVEDAYSTSTGARYLEIACLLAGRRGSVVAVGASPPQDWARVSPLLERAITSVDA
jgi:hypothetical protein